MNSASVETEFKKVMLYGREKQWSKPKFSPGGVRYLTLIYKNLQNNPNLPSYLDYFPSFSRINSLPTKEKAIQIPITNAQCLNPLCIFDLTHFIQYIKAKSIKSIEDKIQCPNCNKELNISEYGVDLGFEFILREFLRTPYLKDENGKREFAMRKELPNGYFLIHRDGTYLYFEKHENREPATITKKIIEAAFTKRFLKALYANDDKSINLLKVKKLHVLRKERGGGGEIIPLNKEFCIIKMLHKNYLPGDVKSVYNHVGIWLPKETGNKNAALKERSKVDFARRLELKDEAGDLLTFHYFSCIIKVPEIGFWITGGTEKKPECYQVRLAEALSEESALCMKMPDLPKPLLHHAGICVNEYIYICGGKSASDALSKDSWRINWQNPTANKWEFCGEMKYPRRCHSLANIGDRIYCLGGGVSQEIGVPDVEYYDIKEKKWNKLELRQNDLRAQAYMLAQPLGEDKILLSGGVILDQWTRETESFLLDTGKKTLVAKELTWEKSYPGAFSDFTENNSLRNPEDKKYYFLGPYRSTTANYSMATYALKEDFRVECDRLSMMN